MKKITLVLSLVFCFNLVSMAQNRNGERTVFGKNINPENTTSSNHRRCGTTEHEAFLNKKNPNRETVQQFESWMAQKIKEQKANPKISSQLNGIIYIPVVVHVIHDGDSYGDGENIPDEQIESQITVLNQDFRRMINTPGFNSNPVGADVEVEFVLAKVDPNGQPTNGINRFNFCKESWSVTDIDNMIKPTTIWDPNSYMNIWTVKFTDELILGGVTTFPESSDLQGLDPSSNVTIGTETTDGIIAGYNYFGSTDIVFASLDPNFDKGRRITHEVGHFLGLRHLSGDVEVCPTETTNVDTNLDFVADTPASLSGSLECVTADTCPLVPGNDMIENYMDFRYDTCMNIFTAGQKSRMLTVLNNSPRRASLKTSNKDEAIPLFENDASVVIDPYCYADINMTSCIPVTNDHKVYLYNRGTTAITSATINYNINGGTSTSYEFNGFIEPNKSELISFTTVESTGTLNVIVESVNGVTDERISNNTASKTFAFPELMQPTNYNFTEFTFRLQGDRYGKDTTWEIKDATDTVFYSGGPYSELGEGKVPAPIVENWTLPANGCYTFTILDSYKDGLESPAGYSVTTNNGATTVILGSSGVFASRTSSFRNLDNLASNSFDLLNEVSLYPNPAKNLVTISIPQGLVANGKFEIYNAIGQKVAARKVAQTSDLNINVQDYRVGMYLVNITLGDYTKTLRFIKE